MALCSIRKKVAYMSDAQTCILSGSEREKLEEYIVNRYKKELLKYNIGIGLTSVMLVAYNIFIVAYNAKIGVTGDIISLAVVLELIGFAVLLSLWIIPQKKLKEYRDIKESLFIRHVLMNEDKDTLGGNGYITTVVKQANVDKVISKHSIRASIDGISNGIFTIEHNHRKVNDKLNYVIFDTKYGKMSIDLKAYTV